VLRRADATAAPYAERSIVRGITIYDEPFWRNDGLNGMSVAPDLPVPVALDQSPRSEKPAFSALQCSDRKRSGPRRSILRNARHLAAALAARYGSKAWRKAAPGNGLGCARMSLGGMIAHFAPAWLTNYGHAPARAGSSHSLGRQRIRDRDARTHGRRCALGESAADQVVGAPA